MQPNDAPIGDEEVPLEPAVIADAIHIDEVPRDALSRGGYTENRTAMFYGAMSRPTVQPVRPTQLSIITSVDRE